MRKIKKYIGIVILVVIASNLTAQNTSIVVSNSKENPGSEINIKWVADRIIFDEGVNIYRRREDAPLWIKLNQTPLKVGGYNIPADAFNNDSSLQSYVEMMSSTASSEIKGMAKALILLKVVYSNDFSRYIGVQYDDSTCVEGETYRYMIKRVKGSSEVFEVVSDPVTVGSYIPGAAVEDVKTEAKDKKVNIWWKVENDRFHSVNVYRREMGESAPELVNPQPIVLAIRTGKDGKESYPDVYYVDKTVENGETYIYQLAGIDFFGRETKLSSEIKATPTNKTPPPSPDNLDVKVNLLNLELEWQANDLKKVVGYNVYRTPSIYRPFERINKEMINPIAVHYSDVVDEPGNYYYYVASVDKNGNEGKSNMTMAQVLDVFPPEAPQNLTAQSDSGAVTLTWSGVKDKHLIGYRLYRTVDADKEGHYALMNAYPVEDTVFVDSLPFNARNEFYYRVVSVDSAMNMSEYSNPASVTLPDVVPPDIPFIKEVNNIDGALEIKWLPNLDPDLMGYYLFREEMKGSVPQVTRINNELIEGHKKSYVDLTFLRDTEYKYYIIASDSVGNQSQPSNKYPAIVESQRGIIPAELKNIAGKYNSINKQVVLKWQVKSDGSLKGVVVFRKEKGDKSFQPISGLIQESEFRNKVSVGKEYIYKLTSYTVNGTKWTSKEIIVETSLK